MCGRYSLFVPPDALAEQFDVAVGPEYEPRYNAAPSQSLPVITDENVNTLQFAEWGLIPSWATRRDDGGHINARAETLAEKSSFRSAFEGNTDGPLRSGRCLVPADGFYEWTEHDGRKQPYRVTFEDRTPFAMAGLWAQWRPETTQTGLDAFTDAGAAISGEDVVETFTIVTTEPNEVVAELHDRMAVILPTGDEYRWLSAEPQETRELLEPSPPGEMRTYPVSRAVNNPENDSPALVEPVAFD